MPFQTDQQLAEGTEAVFGEYLTTFVSDAGQVRADLFRNGTVITAHISFPTGLSPSTVTEPYLSELSRYTQNQFNHQQLRVVYS